MLDHQAWFVECWMSVNVIRRIGHNSKPHLHAYGRSIQIRSPPLDVHVSKDRQHLWLCQTYEQIWHMCLILYCNMQMHDYDMIQVEAVPAFVFRSYSFWGWSINSLYFPYAMPVHSQGRHNRWWNAGRGQARGELASFAGVPFSTLTYWRITMSDR